MIRNYHIMEHESVNTGGGHEVVVYRVRLHSEHQTIYVNVSPECTTVTSDDYIRYPSIFDDIDEVLLRRIDNEDWWEAAAEQGSYFLLACECYVDYLKSHGRHVIKHVECHYCEATDMSFFFENTYVNSELFTSLLVGWSHGHVDDQKIHIDSDTYEAIKDFGWVCVGNNYKHYSF